MAIAREAEPVGSLREVREAGLLREDLLGVYRNMVLSRGIEERGHILYRQGKIPGSFYTGRGNEGAAVGVATAMGPDDVGTPTHLEFATQHVADRAEAYGFEGIVVDGTDVLAVYREAKRAIEKAREGGGPTLIECVTLRMEGHAVHDDAFYVPKELFEKWAESDPIERFRTWLRTNADMTDEEEDEITGEVKKTLNDALRRAEESPLPDPATVTEGVYATPEDLDTPHHK